MPSNKKQKKSNYAFIDGQNLYMGVNSDTLPWTINLNRLRRYLREKYSVEEAYYYIGYVQEKNRRIYEVLENSGFTLLFRRHNSAMKGKKKGNVDSDIIFDVMYRMYKREPFDKVVLVSGDGDYKMLVDFLIEENRFEKILFPNRRFASSLYKDLSFKYFDELGSKSIRKKIELKKVEKHP